MIERLQVVREDWRSSSRCAPMFNAHVVARGRRTASFARSRTCSSADVWINGGFFVFRRDILDYDQAWRGARRGAVRAADRGGRARRLPLRRLLGADGHDQGQAAARRPGARRGKPAVAPTPASTSTLGRLMLDARALRARRAAPRPRARRALGRHRDRLRRDAARAAAGAPEVEVTWVVFAAAGARERRGASERRGVPGRRSASHGRRATAFRDGFFPYVGGEVKDVFEELKSRRRARSDPHAHAARPAPGPPASSASSPGTPGATT